MQPHPHSPLKRTLEIDPQDVMVDNTVEEMTPHSKAHRDKRLADDPDDPDLVPHDPDGVQHKVVGYTAIVAIGVAMLAAVLLIAGGTAGIVAAIGLVAIVLPMYVSKFAERDSVD